MEGGVTSVADCIVGQYEVPIVLCVNRLYNTTDIGGASSVSRLCYLLTLLIRSFSSVNNL